MCGIAGICGKLQDKRIEAMIASQHHRGPDATGFFCDPTGRAAFGHNRLSIIDLSPSGRQPMLSHDGRFQIIFNGEIYNYRELRTELDRYPFRTATDTEVILAAFARWGRQCLERLLGMFAFAIWDTHEQRLFAARDRFGVKPLYYHLRPDGTLLFASEIKALHAAGVPARPDEVAWANYLAYGRYDDGERTFWTGIRVLPAGHSLTWHDQQTNIVRWYDLAARVGPELDPRTDDLVYDEYLALLEESIRLRFRADVPVGINLSGGLDSSLLLGLVQRVFGRDSTVKAFTFATGDERYDELPWVAQMLAHTRHPSLICRLAPEEVPALAASVQRQQDEPFGGLPTLAYARLFEQARAEGVIVLLDGQGMDEQWAGYDYYQATFAGGEAGLVQGVRERPVRPECLQLAFRALAEPAAYVRPFADGLRNTQYRDIVYTKIPRALRFNDRISMRASTELREPFLDHRLIELALRQPPERKIKPGVQKWLPRQIARRLLPERLAEAPKRPVQTPQREWLRGPLADWASAQIELALTAHSDWLDPVQVREAWRRYRNGEGDNSFFVWQWISLGLQEVTSTSSPGATA